MNYRVIVLMVIVLMIGAAASAGGIKVGPDEKCKTIADAVARARPGDVIVVYPRPDNEPYQQVAVLINKKNLTIRAENPANQIMLSGKGFSYSGEGKVPRAVFQFDPGADGCVLDGFDISEAHNNDGNASGVRINRANNVVIRNCKIRNCDMGIMSNGDAAAGTGANQRIESCCIFSNGSDKKPGQSHNLYLGGTSVTVSACEILWSTNGHNIKSRAHFTRVEYCRVLNSANREFDLVDDKANTTVKDSHAVLLGNIIVKASDCKGNKAVIHFGQDSGNEHDGTIWLVHNTIITPFISPVLDISASKAGATLINNIVWKDKGTEKDQCLISLRNGARGLAITGQCNFFSKGFESLPDGVVLEKSSYSADKENSPFVDAVKWDFSLKTRDRRIVGVGIPWSRIKLPKTPGIKKYRKLKLLEYVVPLTVRVRPGFKNEAQSDLGAYGFVAKGK